MRAAVLTRYREPLEFQDNLPMPAAGPDDVVIRVEACGICRSDWHLWQEDWTWMGISVPLPRVQGHEFGGVVEEVGSGVRRLKRGDRVTVPFHIACGHCGYCHTGRSNICYALGFYGFHHNGGFGEYATLPNGDVNAVSLADTVDAVSAAALGCRFMTAFLPGLMPLHKGGRHVQLGLPGKDDKGSVSLPIDAICAQELKVFGSVGCPTTSYRAPVPQCPSAAVRLTVCTAAPADCSTAALLHCRTATNTLNFYTSSTYM